MNELNLKTHLDRAQNADIKKKRDEISLRNEKITEKI